MFEHSENLASKTQTLASIERNCKLRAGSIEVLAQLRYREHHDFVGDVRCLLIIIKVTEPDATHPDVVRDDSHNTDGRIDQRFGHRSGVGEDEEEFGFGCGFAADMGATRTFAGTRRHTTKRDFEFKNIARHYLTTES